MPFAGSIAAFYCADLAALWSRLHSLLWACARCDDSSMEAALENDIRKCELIKLLRLIEPQKSTE